MTTTTPRTTTFLLRQPRQAQGFAEPLAEGVALTQLWIPPGRFKMGSPETELERQEDEGPQHLVQLQGFFMGQTPITQAQWRAVAQWQPREGERWEQELSSNPSRFQVGGDTRLLSENAFTDDRPVEQVSWGDAMEFCHRLSQRTGRHYTLPSEAQWEYACRGGTITPFSFGETITTDLANYDGNATYGNGPTGKNRKQTTPVGMFPANAWGLQDMHGNVWEWCLDDWHGSYEGAPVNGSAWVDGAEGKSTKGKEERKLLRGGSWYVGPWDCRSACRYRDRPGFAYLSIGFRVVCLPQVPSLNP
jgi:formylglycine-generating enzyme required for sulfatase activity